MRLLLRAWAHVPLVNIDNCPLEHFCARKRDQVLAHLSSGSFIVYSTMSFALYQRLAPSVLPIAPIYSAAGPEGGFQDAWQPRKNGRAQRAAFRMLGNPERKPPRPIAAAARDPLLANGNNNDDNDTHNSSK